MLWWVLPLLIIITLVSYIVFAPFYIDIDSRSRLFGIRFHRLARARLLWIEDSIKIEVKVAGWGWLIDPLKRKAAKPGKIPAVRVRQKKKSAKGMLKMFLAMVNSFKVNQCIVSVDLGDVQANGLLYPLFYWVGRRIGKRIEINFVGENEVIIEVENNIAGILKIFIVHSFILKHNNHGKLK